ncbi:MAG: Lrp/AsnC family transcriptional regulator [Halobaculum sp.]|jgi:DNA-binding Lrp family transcriptional regulator
MVYAYVMVRAGTGVVEQVASAVREVSEVLEAHVVAGDYDVIAEVETDEMYEAMQVVARKIHELDGAEATKTYVSIG